MSNKERRKAPVLRFKGFTDDWEQRKFNELGKLYYGKSAPKWSVVEKGGTPCIRYGELYTKYSSKIDNIYSHTSIDKSKLKFSTGNELLIPRVGEEPLDFAKHTSWLSIPNVAIGEMITVLKTKENPLFLANYLRAKYVFKFARLVEGGNVSNLYFERYEDTIILIPSKNEQQNISKLILKIDKLITLQQRKLNILKQLKKTYLSEMYPIEKLYNPRLRFLGFSTNWKEYQIKQLGKVITGSTPSTKHSEYYNKDGIPWVTPTDIHQNITYSSSRKLSTEGQKKARIVPRNTILVTCIASIGKNTILGKTGSFNQQINGLIPDFKKYDLYFLFTQTEFWSLKMKQLASAGTMQIVNKKEFENIETFIPNLNEQQKIGSLFLQLDNCVSDVRKKITSFKQIKNFLLQNMFI